MMIVRRNSHVILLAVALAGMLAVYFATHPRGFSLTVLNIWANQGAILALAALAQMFVVLCRGIDLSIGGMIAVGNVAASYLMLSDGPILFAAGGAVILITTILGLISGAIVVFLRLPSIIVTLATGAVWAGVALLLRPTPGGEISFDLGDTLTGSVFGFPIALIVAAIAAVLCSLFLRRARYGLAIRACGASGKSSRLAGVPVTRARLLAFALSGACCGLAALLVSALTLTGDAVSGTTYTLHSIAAVVVGGVALSGGVGGATGAVLGAFLLRTVTALVFFSGFPALAQPLFEGLMLAAAVALGALPLLRSKDRLSVMAR